LPGAEPAGTFRRCGRESPIAGALAALAIGGCGEEERDDPVARAAVVTSQQGTARFRVRGRLELQGGTLPVSGIGVAKIRPDSSDSRLRMKVRAADRSGTVVELEHDMSTYTGGSLLDGAVPGGKAWMRIDVRRVMGDIATKLDIGGGVVTEALSLLRKGAETQSVAAARIRGRPATHYRGVIDLEEAIAREEASWRPFVRQIQGDRTRVPLDVWIDGKGRILRYRGPVGLGPTGLIDVTLDFLRFGVPVHVDVPSAGETFDATDLMRRQLTGQTG
jgi:hypothetical protein